MERALRSPIRARSVREAPSLRVVLVTALARAVAKPAPIVRLLRRNRGTRDGTLVRRRKHEGQPPGEALVVSTIPFGVGDQVEVRIAYNRSWSAGFEIAGVVEGGYRIRRHSDGRVLPGPTGASDLRALTRRRV